MELIGYNSIEPFDGSSMRVQCEEVHLCIDVAMPNLPRVKWESSIERIGRQDKDCIHRKQYQPGAKCYSYLRAEALKYQLLPFGFITDFGFVDNPILTDSLDPSGL